MRSHQGQDVAGLQHTEPLLCCDGTDATVGPQRSKVKQLPTSGRTHFDEGLELAQVSDGNQLAHIALNVSGHVVAKPVVGLNITVIQTRKAALQEHLTQRAG